MNNKEIRKKALSRLSYYWVEAEFLFMVAFGMMALFMTSAYIIVLILRPDLGTFDFPLKLPQIIEAFNASAEVRIAAIALPIIMTVFFSPLFYGIKWCYYQAAQGKNAPVSGAFYGYFSLRKWGKAIMLNLLVFIRKLVYFIPITAVGGAIYYIFINLLNNTESSFLKALLYFGMILVQLGLSLIYMIVTVKFQLIPYYFAEEPEKSIFDIYHRGVNAMSGSKGRFSALLVCFLPMLALCLTGYLAMFVIPYYIMVKSICAAEISGGKLFDDPDANVEKKNEREAVKSAV
ncbi:MAG: hypothetical protein ACI4K7_00680 [Oscillospiraceae bacterium]